MLYNNMSHFWGGGVLAALAVLAAIYITNAQNDDRWKGEQYNIDTEFCNIERLHLVSRRHFLMKIAGKRPVIFRDPEIKRRNSRFTQLVSRDSLLSQMRDMPMKLSSSNSYSHARKKSTVGEYLDKHILTHEKATRSNETWYFFGENYDDHWKQLNKKYAVPPFPGSEPPVERPPALSFGIGGRGSGVAFHFHGPGFAEVFHGRKRWFLYEQEYAPNFDPDRTQIDWLNSVYWKQVKGEAEKSEQREVNWEAGQTFSKMLDVQGRGCQSRRAGRLGKDCPYECTIFPGDLIYFPHKWYHSTLNLDPYTSFMSTFTDEQDLLE